MFMQESKGADRNSWNRALAFPSSSAHISLLDVISLTLLQAARVGYVLGALE